MTPRPHQMLALASALLAACSPSPPRAGSGEWQSGSRLRARLERASDGTGRFLGWRDTALGIDCAFARDTSGVIRCLPIEGLDLVYADAACARPMHRLAECGAPPTFATVPISASPDPCGSADPLGAGQEVHRIDATAAVTETYFFGPPTACVAAAQPAARLAPDTGVVDPTQFVAATRERVALVGRLEEDVVVASDGARQRVGLFDTGLREPCTPSEAGLLGADACIPEHRIAYAEVIPWRADAACTHVLAHAAFPTSCRPPVVELHTHQDGCVFTTELDTVGAAVTVPIYEGRDAAHCMAVPDRPTEIWYEVGPPIADDLLVRTATERRGAGGARVRVSVREGVTLATLGWEDASGIPCSPTLFADGITRCMRATERVDGVVTFADAACTQALYGGATCEVGHVGLAYTTGACSAPTDAFALDPVTPTATFTRDGTGACVPSTTSAGSYTQRGARLPLDTFPALDIVVE